MNVSYKKVNNMTGHYKDTYVFRMYHANHILQENIEKPVQRAPVSPRPIWGD